MNSLAEHQGILRQDYLVDHTLLPDFRAIENDRHKLLYWVLSVSRAIPYYGKNDEIAGTLSELWHNHVLTVLVEIIQKDLNSELSSFVAGQGSSAQDIYTQELKKKIRQWVGRLDFYLKSSWRISTENPAIKTAKALKETLENAVPASKEKKFRNTLSNVDETSNPYFLMMTTLADIQSKSDNYLTMIESAGNMDASLSLLLVFVRHYCDIIGRFNKKFSGLGNFYRKELLHVTPNPAVQDSTYIIVTPTHNEGHQPFMLPAGTRFTAGDNEDGTPLYYRLKEKAHVSPVEIISANTVYPKNFHLYTASALPAEKENHSPLFDENNPFAVEAGYGWLIASPMFQLSEGKRSIHIDFYFNEHEKEITDAIGALTEHPEDAFTIWSSGSEGWKKREYELNYNKDKFQLSFQLGIPENEEAPSVCIEEIHGISTNNPAVRILSGNRKYLDNWASDVSIKDIVIRLDVKNIRSFTLYSELGEIDSSQSFYPFGTLGECGSWFIFGHKELETKPISIVSLNAMWNKLPPNGFTDIYKTYETGQPITDSSFQVSYECQEYSGWKTCGNTLSPLFRQEPSGNLSETAQFRFVVAEPTSLLAKKNTAYHLGKKGFFRIKLQQPVIGFGMNAYRNQFTETMIHNSRQKEKHWKPVPEMPQIPLLADASIDYNAVQSVISSAENELYRITDPVGYERKTAEETINCNFFPRTDLQVLALKLGGTENIDRIRLYFDLNYVRRNNMPEVGESEKSMQIEYYAEKKWRKMLQENILVEETNGLTRSGFIELRLQQTEDPAHAKIRMVFNGNAPSYMQLNGIYPNCFNVVAENGNGLPLPAGTIVSLAEKDSRVERITQPLDGYGGKPDEQPEDTAIRQATRISTRNRAICRDDFERIVLERFTEIEKVCCIPASSANEEIQLVVFPKPERRQYPQLQNWKLNEVQRYLTQFLSPFARIRVMNALYEPLSVTFHAILKDGQIDEGEVRRRLYKCIYDYFAPWYLAGTLPEIGQRFSLQKLRSLLVNDEAIEDTVSLKIAGEEIGEVTYEPGEDTYYTGKRENSVVYFDPKKSIIKLTRKTTGIGDIKIGNDFIIG